MRGQSFLRSSVRLKPVPPGIKAASPVFESTGNTSAVYSGHTAHVHKIHPAGLHHAAPSSHAVAYGFPDKYWYHHANKHY